MNDKKITNIGGQAIIEGIMMRGPNKIAMAVRKQDGEIIVEEKEIKKKGNIYKIPIIRGLISFFDSMIIGVKALMFSAKFFDIAEEKENDGNKGKRKSRSKLKDSKKENELPEWMMYISMIVSVLISVGMFILFPNFLSSIIVPNKENHLFLYNLMESILRMSIFIIYLVLVSRMKDIQRVFEYHGAEHKSIFCYENGEELTVSNIKRFSRFHPRCGTSFLLFVMIISIILFSIVGRHPNIFVNMGIRLLLLPLIAGISYEIIKIAGKSQNPFVTWLNKPGMWLQRLTTKEPDDMQIEVAIASLQAVIPENKDEDKW